MNNVAVKAIVVFTPTNEVVRVNSTYTYPETAGLHASIHSRGETVWAPVTNFRPATAEELTQFKAA